MKPYMNFVLKMNHMRNKLLMLYGTVSNGTSINLKSPEYCDQEVRDYTVAGSLCLNFIYVSCVQIDMTSKRIVAMN